MSAPGTLTLYRRVLGEEFETLPGALRAFHSRLHGGTARGTLRVTGGEGPIRALAARLLRLPHPGPAVPLRVRVVVTGDREQWIRDFGGIRMATIQWHHRGLLIEAMGPLRVGFRVIPRRDGMHLEATRSWFLLLPLPRALTPGIHGTATAADGAAWTVRVRVEAPLLGLLLAYEGTVTPDDDCPDAADTAGPDGCL